MRRLLLLLLPVLLAACPRAPRFPATAANVRAEVLHAPERARIGEREVLAYEVLVHNGSDEAIDFRSLVVHAAPFADVRLEGDPLFGRITLVPAGDAASADDLLAWRAGQHLDVDEGEIPGAATAAVFLWLEAPAGATLPAAIRHELTLRTGHGALVLATDTSPAARAPLVLSPPLRGGPWLFMNGLLDAPSHARTLVPIHGRPWGAQRFAADILRLGPDGRPLPAGTSPADSARFYGYGADVLAVADATVAAVRDGIPENRADARAVRITLDTVTGNAVFLDLGEGRFAFYAHLQPGSITVRPGDHVARGQVLGKLGHSGNSTAPHLHFHVCSAPTGLECDGLPYAFDGFEARHVSKSGTLGDDFVARVDGPPVRVTGSLPGQDVAVTFP